MNWLRPDATQLYYVPVHARAHCAKPDTGRADPATQLTKNMLGELVPAPRVVCCCVLDPGRGRGDFLCDVKSGFKQCADIRHETLLGTDQAEYLHTA